MVRRVRRACQTLVWNSVPAGERNIEELALPGKYSASCRSADKSGVARISTSWPRRTRRALSFSHRIAARLASLATSLSRPTGESIRLKTRFMSSIPRCFAWNPPCRRIPSAVQRLNERAGDHLGGPPAQLAFVVRISPRPGGSVPRTWAIGAAEVSDKSGLDPMDRTKEIHLTDIDAVVAEDRIRHHDMEIDVRDRHLQQVVLAAKDLAGRPGEADLPLGRTGVLRFRHALRECDGLPDAGAHLIDRLLVVLVFGRRLPGEPSRRRLDVVACALNLVDEWLHVGREAAGHQDADIKRLGARVLLSLVEPAFEILRHLRALRNGLVIHCFLPFV